MADPYLSHAPRELGRGGPDRDVSDRLRFPPVSPAQNSKAGKKNRRPCGVWESVAIALAETMAESGHYNIDSTTVRARVSAAGGKGGLSTSSWPLAGRVHQ
jgi:hypothetical protein